ncbi:MAG TPA: ferredoxin--NADP reductase [Myxococcota bacterium]|nr:ferredoxin--NADP reductase [Myxococcota bacterium]
MIDPTAQGVSAEHWREVTESCHELRVARVVAETHDAVSLVLEIPPALATTFRYRAGQFLTFKVPYQGRVLVRSYSLSSSPDVESEHKVTVKRVELGRISNWMNDAVAHGSPLMVVPPAGVFVLDPAATRDILFFSGGSGITPCISIIKTALATTRRRMRLVYANRDARSIIFAKELTELAARHPERLEVFHSLDDERGFLGAADVAAQLGSERDRDFYLCGPAAFMDTVEHALREQGVARERIHIERFISPPDHDVLPDEPAAHEGEIAPASITLVLDGKPHEVPYQAGERVLHAARRAGLDPPFSCEEGYCSCCMAKLVSGKVEMAANDCLTPELLADGWVLTCQSRCVSKDVKLEYPD